LLPLVILLPSLLPLNSFLLATCCHPSPLFSTVKLPFLCLPCVSLQLGIHILQMGATDISRPQFISWVMWKRIICGLTA